MTGQQLSRHKLLLGHLRETKESHANPSGQRRIRAPVKEVSSPSFSPYRSRALDWLRSCSPSEGGNIWRPMDSPCALFFRSLLRTWVSLTVCQGPGSCHLLPQVPIPHEPWDCTTLTLGPSGPGQPMGPGIPGTPGGPGLPFKVKEQKSGKLDLFPSFQETRFVSGAQRSVGPLKHSLRTLISKNW